MTDSDAPDPDWEFVRQQVRVATVRTRDPVARARQRRALAELAPNLGEPLTECPDCHMILGASRLDETTCEAHHRH